MTIQPIYFIGAMILASCTNTGLQTNKITDVYVADFSSDDIESCRPSDVGLSHSEAKDFFIKAKQLEYTSIHDHYEFAPCFIEGTLKYDSMVCEWEIRASATGQIKCDKNVYYFACDTCDDLFLQ